MGLWPFGRKKSDDMDVQTLLDRANVASPTGPAAAAPPAVPASAGDGTFRLPVEDVFSIRGRGTVVTGRVESGSVHVGLQVQVVRGADVVATTKVTGVEMFRKVQDSATVGDNVGLLLADVTKDQVRPGDLVQG
jgi:translation elongation factor EF-Tu-like GTPase